MKELIGKIVYVSYGELKNNNEYSFQKGRLISIDNEHAVLDVRGKKYFIKSWIKINEAGDK